MALLCLLIWQPAQAQTPPAPLCIGETFTLPSKVLDETRRLAAALRAVASLRLSWHYEPLPQETHGTICHPAAPRAFRTVFKP